MDVSFKEQLPTGAISRKVSKLGSAGIWDMSAMYDDRTLLSGTVATLTLLSEIVHPDTTGPL